MRPSELDEAGLGDVLAEVLDSAKELSRAEIALARRDAERDMAAFQRAGVLFGAAMTCVSVSLALALCGAAMALQSWLFAVVVGAAFAVLSGVLLVIARGIAPKDVMERTRLRATSTVRALTEEL